MAKNTLPTQSYLCECFDYSPTAGTLTWRRRPLRHFKKSRDSIAWNSKMARKVAGTRRIRERGIYIGVSVNKSIFLAHRIIWKMMTGEDPVFDVDHKDRNGVNNVWDNLRLATSVQNRANSKRQNNNTSGFKGVRRVGNGERFTTRIFINGRNLHLGTFFSAEEAHAAYCKAAQELHGEFWNPG